MRGEGRRQKAEGRGFRFVCLLPSAFCLLTLPVFAGDSLQFSGFALLRASSPTDRVPLEDRALLSQVHLGIDWRPSMSLGAHVHLLGRTDNDGRRSHAGVVEAYLEQNVVRGDHRVHLMEGAFFLPGTRENVDALWETPYTITPSALTSWMGEELRPIGVDASYTWRRMLSAGVTVFRGNDTFGALPVDRGWMLRDHWITLGEWIPVGEGYYTSASAETDHRLGWSARARWHNEHATVQLTRIDNRADALEHGDLVNWSTQFDILGADYTLGDWTVAGEYGWGVSSVIFDAEYPTDLRASYLLLSRRLGRGRATIRGDAYQSGPSHDHAIIAAYLWTARPKLRAGVEGIVAGRDRKVSLELRYSF